MFETVSVDNANSWISGGSFVGIMAQVIWCKLKIKSQCSTITELKKDMKEKVDEKVIDRMDTKNDTAHGLLFKQINDLPEKIINLIKDMK